ncbi:CAP domain-containing protein [Leptotrichia sp. HSP-536]|uniref:CAP domain-containing protein n=1 Tax=Leptotrichia alba TaxID=3239304 RepID=A0AB39V5L0_9FUSO
MKKIKNKVLIIVALALISLSTNAGWAKHRDKILKTIKKWLKPYEQQGNDNSGIKTNNNFQMEVVRLVNIERRKRGIASLSVSNELSKATAIRADEISRKYSHTRPDGSSYLTVLKTAGYMHSYVGENIAAGQKSPEEVMNAWMNSSGHRANILNPNYTEMGVGFTYATNSIYGTYWVQLFGRPGW